MIMIEGGWRDAFKGNIPRASDKAPARAHGEGALDDAGGDKDQI